METTTNQARNKPNEKQTKDVDSVETITNGAKDKPSKNVEIIKTITPSKNVETITKLIPDKTTQLRSLKFRLAITISLDLLNSLAFYY